VSISLVAQEMTLRQQDIIKKLLCTGQDKVRQSPGR